MDRLFADALAVAAAETRACADAWHAFNARWDRPTAPTGAEWARFVDEWRAMLRVDDAARRSTRVVRRVTGDGDAPA